MDGDGRGVIVEDRAKAAGITDGGANDVGDVDQEALVTLDGGVAVHRHGEGVAVVAGGNDLASQAAGDVIAAGGRGGAIGGGDIEGDAASGRRGGQADGEGEAAGPGIGFGLGDVIDAEDRGAGAAAGGQRGRGIARCRCHGGEVAAVLVGIRATVAGAPGGCRVAQHRGRCAAFEEVRAAETHQVHDQAQLRGRARRGAAIAGKGRGGVGQDHLAGGAGHGAGAAGIDRRQCNAVGANGGHADQEVLTRGKADVGKGRAQREVAGASGAGVLHAQAVERNARRAAVEQFHEVAVVRRPRVAAPAIDLAYDNLGMDRAGRQQQQASQRETPH